MRRRIRIECLLAALILAWWGAPGLVRAQGVTGMPASMGPVATPGGQMYGTGAAQTPAADEKLSINDTFVSFIDSAVPRNVIGLRFDGLYNNRQPMRAEYLHPKGGLPNSVGFPLPEARVDYQELTSYAEFGLTPWLSIFAEGPYRWLNPEINRNQSGTSDMRYGMRVCTWSDENIIATILLRLYQPTARHETLGTSHWTVEPGLLAAYRINPSLHLEGEFRYWIPLGGNDFSGDILRYGLGISYGQRQANTFWYMPVLEGIGWTVMGGKTMVASAPDSFVIQDARHQTIANGYLGLRVGYAQNVDLYIGYGRSLTGHFWARETYRLEVRLSY